MRKNLFVCVLALALVMCMPGLAGANVSSFSLDTYNASLNEYSGTIAVGDYSKGRYILMDSNGNELTTVAYQNMYPMETGFQVAIEEGVNKTGYINAQGVELVPMEYGDIKWLAEEWQVGVKLEEATAENYDYESFGDDGYFLVSSYDIFFNGALIGSLGRMEYDYAYAYGDYLYVCDREDNSHFYNSAFEKSAYTDGDYYDEYNYDYESDEIWHAGSNQQAFVPGCTLTSDEVEQDLYEMDNGKVVDLQGNVVFDTDGEYWLYSEFYGDYAVVSNDDGLLGVVDRNGKLVLACEYDEIEYYDGLFLQDYQCVVKDGKVGYVDINGNTTCEFKYSEGNFDFLTSPMTTLTDMEGNAIVLSGAIGELPQTYAEVRVHYDSGCIFFSAVDENGNAGVVDMYGNVIVPFDGTYDSVYDFEIASGSPVVTAYDGDQYHVFSVTYDGEPAAAQPTVEETPAVDEPAAEAPAADEPVAEKPGSEKKDSLKDRLDSMKQGASAEETVEEPAADSGWSCADCGTANSGKFCTECGSAKPAEKAVCSGCGYEPDGETPKFCPECGTKF